MGSKEIEILQAESQFVFIGKLKNTNDGEENGPIPENINCFEKVSTTVPVNITQIFQIGQKFDLPDKEDDSYENVTYSGTIYD